MKKTLIVFLAAVLSAGSLLACGTQTATDNAGDNRINIVTTIFPEYDWVKSVLGDNPADAEVTMLLDNGVDLHSYQPTAEDILKISTCDLFVYVGGESDEWVDDALKEATNENMIVIDLLDVLGDKVREEEVIEGMQEEEEEHGEGEEEEEPEYDEHVWLSLRNSEIIVKAVCEAIQKVDPDNSVTYKNNTDEYIKKLQDLDAQYKDVADSAAVPVLLFGDRFPFRYLTDDYGLDYYAAFVGCSAETEASFETISFLSSKVDELGLKYVMTIEGNDHRIAETIIKNSQSGDGKILTLDSMQSTTAADVQNGTTYLSVMTENLSVLKEALN